MLEDRCGKDGKRSKFTVFNLSDFIAEYSTYKFHIILRNTNNIIQSLPILYGAIFIKIKVAMEILLLINLGNAIY